MYSKIGFCPVYLTKCPLNQDEQILKDHIFLSIVQLGKEIGFKV